MKNINVLKIVTLIGKRKDLFLAFLLVSIVFLMILPVPTAIVDILIAINIGMSIILLMLAIYISSPLEFSSFPAVLLLTTLFRLALSITTTRLILLQADAGNIVTAFGNFVVGGNWAVGIVVFLIITIVQFLVITKGSERVAEVGARFSLDAMPGKQMSIDGDMRAGVIDSEMASARRSDVEKESQLYGSMDGAMKFVKGDAIAGLIIIVINILGGISIGVAQNNMSFGDAIELYTILTVGDGLVSQIPALLISITAGFIVTRVSQDESQDLGEDIGNQIIGKPNAIKIGAVMMLIFSLIPGFPTITFLAIAAFLGALGFWLTSTTRSAGETKAKADSALLSPVDKNRGGESSEAGEFSLTVPLMVDIAENTDSFINRETLNSNLYQVRKALYMDLGVPFPGLNLRFNATLPNNQYRVLLNEIPVVSGTLRENSLLIVNQLKQLNLLEIEFEEDDQILAPQKGYWVEDKYEERLSNLGITALQNTQVLTFHLSHVLKRYAEEFIGIQETHFLFEKMEPSYGELLSEVQRIIPIQRVTEILQRLVSEDVSIRNLRLILESIVEWGPKEKDLVTLVEYIRSNLKRQISYKFSNEHNVLSVYLIEESLEEVIRCAIRQTSTGSYLALDPQTSSQFLEAAKTAIGDISEMNVKPVVLASMDIRRYIRKLLEQDFYDLSILSHQDITKEIYIQPIGKISI